MNLLQELCKTSTGMASLMLHASIPQSIAEIEHSMSALCIFFLNSEVKEHNMLQSLCQCGVQKINL